MDPQHPSYLTGNHAIDVQHARIYRLLEALNVALEGGQGLPEAKRILAALSLFVVAHFRMEEAVMEQAGCPDLERHRVDHADIARWVESMVDAFREGCLRPEALATFMSDWVDRHIEAYDNPMARFLAGQGAATPAAGPDRPRATRDLAAP